MQKSTEIQKQIFHTSLHAYMKIVSSPLFIDVSSVFKPTYSLHTAYIQPTQFCLFCLKTPVQRTYVSTSTSLCCKKRISILHIFPLMQSENSLENLVLTCLSSNCYITMQSQNSLENFKAYMNIKSRGEVTFVVQAAFTNIKSHLF